MPAASELVRPRRAGRLACALVGLAGLTSCSGGGGPDGGGDAAGVDATRDVVTADVAPPTDAPSPDDASGCTDAPAGVVLTPLNRVEPEGGRPGVRAWRVTYPSTGGLLVHGQICAPETPGPHPIAVFNHGGADGLGLGEWGARAGNQCHNLATNGYVAVMAQYRGEVDRGVSPALGPIDIASQGRIELCAGEADDILALVEVAKRRCDVDPGRVVMFGISHGGCLGLQIARRRVPGLRAVVALVPPTDFAELYRYHAARVPGGAGAPDACDPVTVHQSLTNAIAAAVGTPEANAAGFEARSVQRVAGEVARTPAMVIFGATDCHVPLPAHGCALRNAFTAAGTRVVNLRLDTMLRPVTTAPAGCEGIAFEPAWPADNAWTADHYFIVLDGQDHGTASPMLLRGLEAAARFLLAHQS